MNDQNVKWTIHNENTEKQLEKSGYGVYNHSAVEICHWTKEAIVNGRGCYKRKFYNIDTAGCMEMTQSVMWCTNRCTFCWRPNKKFEPYHDILPENSVDSPEETIENLRKLRKNLLIGFYGNPKANKKLLDKFIDKPTHVTFSLSGEPLLYPKVAESILYIKKNWPWIKSIFIVTSGEVPEALEKLISMNAYPTQLYISFTGSNPDMYRKISVPIYKDYWDRYLRSLEIASNMKTRRVARYTILKGINDDKKYYPEWAKLLELYNPHFIELKGYSLLGYSRERLKMENVPKLNELIDFAEGLVEYLPGYEIYDKDKDSRIVLIKNRRKGMDIDPIIKSVEPNI
ncbi:tRNA wybutosine-synthesizing protein 1 [Nanobdella aerobiophila]|uniref:tRNA wybutosine-synthesizing protein 1 n=1 Tax=Nanobdella aerobiophila TaxID=2586965 RepID=A0A915SYE9_9ARCH|nr:radical SAM protein [Nanobdella aerobiophila]BBL45755.1 tRNA wybutosine-synthesizing protein 1 [Nanobdella aerobiophila]